MRLLQTVIHVDIKSLTYFPPWKIPGEVDSSIIGGLTSTVENECISNQHSDAAFWGDLHISKNTTCKMGTYMRLGCSIHKEINTSLYVSVSFAKKTTDSLCPCGMY